MRDGPRSEKPLGRTGYLEMNVEGVKTTPIANLKRVLKKV